MLRSIVALALIAACADRGPAPPVELPPPSPPTVRDDTPELVFGYIDPVTKAPVSTSSIGAIPEAARAHVTVADLGRSPAERQAARYVFIADLRAKSPDGSYPVAVASRHGSDAKPASEVAATSGVVIYTTSWCGVCKRAKALLRELGVPFEEKDVEASRSAAEELAAKAQRAGLSLGGVPVIDVGGVLLQGLDEGSLRRALRDGGLLR